MSAVEVSFAGPRADIRLNRPDVLNAVNLDVFATLYDQDGFQVGNTLNRFAVSS